MANVTESASKEKNKDWLAVNVVVCLPHFPMKQCRRQGKTFSIRHHKQH